MSFCFVSTQFLRFWPTVTSDTIIKYENMPVDICLLSSNGEKSSSLNIHFRYFRQKFSSKLDWFLFWVKITTCSSVQSQLHYEMPFMFVLEELDCSGQTPDLSLIQHLKLELSLEPWLYHTTSVLQPTNALEWVGTDPCSQISICWKTWRVETVSSRALNMHPVQVSTYFWPCSVYVIKA